MRKHYKTDTNNLTKATQKPERNTFKISNRQNMCILNIQKVDRPGLEIKYFISTKNVYQQALY